MVNWLDSWTPKTTNIEGFGSPDSQTPETPNIPYFKGIGSPGVQTPETPNCLNILRVLGVSGVWTPGLPIFSKFGILGVSGVWESRTMNCTKAVVSTMNVSARTWNSIKYRTHTTKCNCKWSFNFCASKNCDLLLECIWSSKFLLLLCLNQTDLTF